ncbi:hypothetical protein LZ198_03290 [Myxococcus sp. K15C18031901]|uniref:hypothetical protein n=1 Tax=Myxococcus dinghuensis TaxID=2906761 RepID=UPI0020A797B9|nr:hypothetical protein [Myxococcus dinghuensis]MCP3097896.1 hypothetical protein [Myxococcus dinghuensis]
MTRNVKRFLAGSLLSLAPSIAFAGQTEFGFPDVLSQRGEYVTLRSEGIPLPVRNGEPVQSIGPATEDLLVLNQTGANVSLGIQILTGTLNGVYAPYPLTSGSYGGYQVAAPTPPAVQQYYWTVDPANPGGVKTCIWRLEVVDAAGICSATAYQVASFGGATCTIDAALSYIDQVSCKTQLVTGIL